VILVGYIWLMENVLNEGNIMPVEKEKIMIIVRCKMKTKLLIEIETPDTLEVFPEEGDSDEDFEEKEKQKELQEFRKDFVTDIHDGIVRTIINYVEEDDIFFENFCDLNEELTMEDWESFDDYKVKISSKRV
jgi:hypothetical protein